MRFGGLVVTFCGFGCYVGLLSGGLACLWGFGSLAVFGFGFGYGVLLVCVFLVGVLGGAIVGVLC